MPLDPVSLQKLIVTNVNAAYAARTRQTKTKVIGAGADSRVLSVPIGPGILDQDLVQAIAEGVATAVVAHLVSSGLVLGVVSTPAGPGTAQAKIV